MDTKLDTWKILSEDEVFAAKPYLRVVRQKVELPEGKIIDDFYQVKLRTYAITVPITTDGKVVMIQQYKHGPGRVGWSFPSGFVDPGEAPHIGAKRELIEESGYTPERLYHMGNYVDNGNQRGCRGHQFVATGCTWAQNPDDGDLEEMRVTLKSPEEVDQIMADNLLGVIHDVAAWGLARTLHRDLF